jgi:hypothetical protein
MVAKEILRGLENRCEKNLGLGRGARSPRVGRSLPQCREEVHGDQVRERPVGRNLGFAEQEAVSAQGQKNSSRRASGIAAAGFGR